MEWLKGFFYFTKAQLRAVVLLCILILVVLILPKVYLQYRPIKFETGALAAAVEKFRADTVQFMAAESANMLPFEDNFEKKGGKNEPQLFMFNPNEIGYEEWLQLGFSEKQAAVIERIKAKGFKFYRAEDLKRIHVIGEHGYERLKAFVEIPNYKKAPTPYSASATAPREFMPVPLLDINTADSMAIDKLPGIGAYFTQKILKYRNALGGFVTIEQLAEIRKLPDSTFQKIREKITVLPAVSVRKISVNTHPADSFARHPYVSYKQAQVIVAYRTTHGGFERLEEVQRAGLFSDSVFNKLKPYLSLE